MNLIRHFVTGTAVLALAAAGFALAPAAQADDPGMADTVFNAWNNAFLVRKNGDTYYADTLVSKGTNRAGTWIGALDIEVAQDVYQRTHRPADRQLVSDLVSTFVKYEGKDWSFTSWNDDVAWMDLAVLRGYTATGNTDWLNDAANNWNMAYNRGWSSAGGGGIWEDNNTKYSKCSLSNNPMITAAVQLYQNTGDGGYLTKAQQIYNWERSNLFNTSSGWVHSCIAFPNGQNGSTEVQSGDNAYDAGSFIEAAAYLYRVTGNSMYFNDAQLAADHIMNTVRIVSNNSERGSAYQYRYFKGLSEFCTDNNLCAKYASYMQSNADAAWSQRNSANLTWNDWTQKTNDSNPDAFEMTGMVALWQQLPITSGSPFSGSYQLQNAASKLDLTVKDNSTANSAPIIQTADAGDSSSWTFTPASNGYYWIKNVRSGQALNVNNATGRLAEPVVQWPAGSGQRNDLWLPVKNADGTWSFYNRNSQFALDNSGGSTASGNPYVQWPQNDSAGQKFTVISRSDGGSPTGPGGGAVRSGIAGKCLDLNGGNTTSGTKVEIWSCNGGVNQTWTSGGDGSLRVLGKCLDATGYGTANLTPVEIWDCTGGSNQVWESYSGGYRNPASGRCLDDPGASTTDGTQVILYDCNGGPQQKWSAPGA